MYASPKAIARVDAGSSRTRAVRIWFGYHWLLFVLLACANPAAALSVRADDTTIPGLFESTDALDVTLKLPWQAIVSDEFFYQGGYPSELEYRDRQGKRVSFALETERRGKSRQVICQYPPIKLRFQQESTKNTIFAGQKSLKLVTHCDNGKKFEQYQVLESLAYRMYNVVTDRSFRIRPLAVTYVDSDSGKADRPKFAFLVEDDNALARRNGLKKLKIPALDPMRMEASEASRLALFQYMIGNTAWSLEAESGGRDCCENLDLLGTDPAAGLVYAVPNDFDSSGLVNAHYAKPAAGLPAANVRERLFLGFCAHNGTLEQARQLFVQKADAMRALVEQEPALTADSHSDTLAFLAPFFEMLGNPVQFEARVTANCRP